MNFQTVSALVYSLAKLPGSEVVWGACPMVGPDDLPARKQVVCLDLPFVGSCHDQICPGPCQAGFGNVLALCTLVFIEQSADLI